MVPGSEIISVYLLFLDFSQSTKLQRGKTTHYVERYRLVYLQECGRRYLLASSLSHPDRIANLCVMASVVLLGLPLLPLVQGAA